MNLFFYLLLTHFLADYPFQSTDLIRLKLKTYWGVLLHCSIHLAVLMIVLYPLLHMFEVWVAIAVIFITHNIIDEIKVTLDRKYPKWHVKLYFLDQLSHLIIVTFVALYVGSISPDTLVDAPFYADKTYVLYVLTLVLSTYFFDVTRYFLQFHKKEITYKRDYKTIVRNAIIVTVGFGVYWLGS